MAAIVVTRHRLALAGALLGAALLLSSGPLLALAQTATATATPTPSPGQAQPTPPAARAAAADEPGVVICSVQREGPAAKAGLARGDILLTLGGATTNTPRDVRTALAARKPGQSVALTATHGDQQRTLTATLGDREGSAFLGVTPCAATLGAVPPAAGPPRPGVPRPPFGPPGPRQPGPDGAPGPGGAVVQGALIADVKDGSPAAAAGLKKDEVITAVDGQALRGPRALADAIGQRKPGDSVALTVRAGRNDPAEREVRVTLGTHPDPARAGSAYLGVDAGWTVIIRRGPPGSASGSSDTESFAWGPDHLPGGANPSARAPD